MAFPHRSVSLAVSLLSALINVFCVFRILLSWRSLRWDFSGVDDTDAFPINVDPLHVLWSLMTLYFTAAAVASIVGCIGIARNSLSYVRFFRDYSIADLLFVLLSALTMSYLSFSPSSSILRNFICNELGRQPELLRDVADSGLNMENCEYWLERGVILMIAMYMVFVTVKLHFVIALSKYYNQLRRASLGYPPWYISTEAQSMPLQRIYLLPTPTSPEYTALPPAPGTTEKTADVPYDVSDSESDAAEQRNGVMLYAPVPLGRVSREEARGMGVRAAWMPSASPLKKHHRHHSHSHVHHSRTPSSSSLSSSSSTRVGSKSHRHHRSMDAAVPVSSENRSI